MRRFGGPGPHGDDPGRHVPCRLLLLPGSGLHPAGAGGGNLRQAWYGAVALLSCLLCPDPEAAALFLFLGYYPIIKGPLDRISPALLRALAKLALFLVACALMYTALLFVLSLEQVAETFRQEAPWMLAVGLALGILTFFLTDFLLTRLEAMWRRRTGKRSE